MTQLAFALIKAGIKLPVKARARWPRARGFTRIDMKSGRVVEVKR